MIKLEYWLQRRASSQAFQTGRFGADKLTSAGILFLCPINSAVRTTCQIQETHPPLSVGRKITCRMVKNTGVGHSSPQPETAMILP